MSKIFWSLVILAPLLLAGVLTTVGVDNVDGLASFNAGGALDQWKIMFSEIGEGIKKNEDFSVWTLIGSLLFAMFLTMPFIFIWKGTKIIGWIPFVGLALRIILIVILIWLPSWEWFWTIFLDASEVEQMQGIFEIIILALAMWGIWFVR